MSIDQIKKVLREHFDMLQDTYHVRRIGVFGSAARGETDDTSDIDILVEFVQPPSFFGFLELENFLSKILGRKVDLVTPKALKPAIREGVVREAVYV